MDLSQSLTESIEIPWKDFKDSRIPRLNPDLPLSEEIPAQVSLSEFILNDQFQDAMQKLYKVLLESLKSRICCIPSQNSINSKLAILFSGGLDCTVLAGLSHFILDLNDSIDLLNVAFENPRKANSSFDVPDRITGKRSYQELLVQFPNRKWNFVEINVPFSEYLKAKPRILRLMNPCSSVMDLSIATALWFASSGNG